MTRDEVFEARRKYRANIPTMHNGAYAKVYDKAINDRSLRAAVKAKCLDCQCWQGAEIRNCVITYCPLYEVRPYAKHPKRTHTAKSPRRTSTSADVASPAASIAADVGVAVHSQAESVDVG